MNKPGSYFSETDSYLIGKTYPQENYGVLEILENTIHINIKDIKGKTLNSIEKSHKKYIQIFFSMQMALILGQDCIISNMKI